MSKTFYDIFRELNSIPRPSHHEEKVADYLCRFAEEHALRYRRDAQNCVVIEKPATPGYEAAEPVVILNHMDMVCVAKDDYLRNGRKFNPLEDEILPYIETDENGQRWMKAEGTSLGADNGMGLSMALAILADDTLVHPAIEVLTTTNEEDGMSGAEALSTDFIRGRKIINLDSEAYNEITVGAAGACLQIGTWNLQWEKVPDGCHFYRIAIEGGLGGHSGVDINKGRCNCNKGILYYLSEGFVDEYRTLNDIYLCRLGGGTANASIASWAEAIVAVPEDKEYLMKAFEEAVVDDLRERFSVSDPGIHLVMEPAAAEERCIADAGRIIWRLALIPSGVIEMRDDMPGTVMTSNNIGMMTMNGDVLTVSCHTRSFDYDKQYIESSVIHDIMLMGLADSVECLMDTRPWMESPDSPLLALTCQTFKDVLGFEPKKVAMHFVLEAAYYVEKYPGTEIASIGPLIIEPHSTSERVNLNTADDIWSVTVELLRRLAVTKGNE